MWLSRRAAPRPPRSADLTPVATPGNLIIYDVKLLFN